MSQVPVVKGVSCVLVHVPGLVPLGSKPSRELAKDRDLLGTMRGHLRGYGEAVGYGPNQAFVGNLRPQALFDAPAPWWQHPVAEAPRTGAFGDILPEEEFWGLLKLADDFDLLHLDAQVAAAAAERLGRHPLLGSLDLAKLTSGATPSAVATGAAATGHLALADAHGHEVGYAVPGYEDDLSQTPHILLENLAAKASGAVALRHLLHQTGTAPRGSGLLARLRRGGGR